MLRLSARNLAPAAVGVALLACGEDGPRYASFEAGVQEADAGLPGPSCAHHADGDPCGAGKACHAGQCQDSLCGDGKVSTGEECDDGNQDIRDGCSPSCKLAPLTCGDAVVQEGEECDDGNWFELDGCSTACRDNVCGNARLDGAEECDDGNALDDDTCSNVCTENRCRNGRVDPGEECDDGNRIHDDGCSNGCKVLVCGNGRTEGPAFDGKEECDDGNGEDADGCSNACTRNECGNLRRDPGELCDGDTAELDCADDCASVSSNSQCGACRADKCSHFMDALDLIAGCVAAPDEQTRKQCTAVVDCAHTHGCGFGEAGGTECFCGAADVNACQTAGAADGPCQAEWYAAAHTSSLADMIGRFSDISLPSGMAYYLLQCERDLCGSECAP